MLDYRVKLATGLALDNPLRVIGNGNGSKFMFTLFQHEGIDDAKFHRDAELVSIDLQTLKKLVEAA